MLAGGQIIRTLNLGKQTGQSKFCLIQASVCCCLILRVLRNLWVVCAGPRVMTIHPVQGSPMKVMSSIPKTITLTPAQMVRFD